MKEINTKNSDQTWMRALLYGASGIGKTTSIRTLQLERTLVLLVEPKHLPLLGYDVDAWEIEDWDDMRLAFGKIRSALAGKGLIVNGRKKDIVVVDSLTEVNERCKAHIIAKDRPELLAKQKKGALGIYDELMAIGDWQLLSTRIDSLVSSFCHLPCHLIVTALEQWTEDKMTGEVRQTPALNGKLALSIAHHFDFCFRFEIVKVEGRDERFFRTSYSQQAMAKGSELLDVHEKPDWTKLMTKVFSAGKPAKQKAPRKAAKVAAKTKGGENGA